MRWILLALVTTTLTCASAGSSSLALVDHKDFNAYGSVDGSAERSCGHLPSQAALAAAPPYVRVKISALANILRYYTDGDDAVRTARRYHEETDDPELWTAMTIVESGCNSAAVSSSGAQGKLQVMPFWKNAPGFEFYSGKDSHLNDDLNFRAAHKVYRMLLGEQKGDKWLAVERYCGVGPDAKLYVARVRQLYGRIKTATELAALNQGGTRENGRLLALR